MCEWTVPFSSAGRHRHDKRGEEACRACKDAANAYSRARIAAVGRSKWTAVWTSYRLRRHEYEAILAHQGGACAVRGDLLEIAAAHTVHVDHDHSCNHPGKGQWSCADCVRGILCGRCNRALFILDDTELLKKAIAYLGREDVAEIIRESRLW